MHRFDGPLRGLGDSCTLDAVERQGVMETERQWNSPLPLVGRGWGWGGHARATSAVSSRRDCWPHEPIQPFSRIFTPSLTPPHQGEGIRAAPAWTVERNIRLRTDGLLYRWHNHETGAEGGLPLPLVGRGWGWGEHARATVAAFSPPVAALGKSNDRFSRGFTPPLTPPHRGEGNPGGVRGTVEPCIALGGPACRT